VVQGDLVVQEVQVGLVDLEAKHHLVVLGSLEVQMGQVDLEDLVALVDQVDQMALVDH
jgi:hypothetical protein